MKHTVVLVLFSLVCFCTGKAQQNDCAYMFVELYADRELQEPISTKRKVSVFDLQAKQPVTELPGRVFCIEGKGDFELTVGKKKILVKGLVTQDRFSIMKVFINNAATTNEAEFSIRSGGMAFTRVVCKTCHTVALIHVPSVTDPEGNVTTGYPALDALAKP